MECCAAILDYDDKKTGASLRLEIQDGGPINERLLLGHSPIKKIIIIKIIVIIEIKTPALQAR